MRHAHHPTTLWILKFVSVTLVPVFRKISANRFEELRASVSLADRLTKVRGEAAESAAQHHRVPSVATPRQSKVV